MSSGLSQLVQASRAVAATTGEPMRVLSATEEALERCWTLIRESGALITSQVNSEERDMALRPLAKGVHESLVRVQSSVPGQKEVEDAIQSISTMSLNLENGSFKSSTGKNYG
jgi:hypothetical protein